MIPKYWNEILQGLSYWIAYKKQYFKDHLLTEGAIVAELTQLLSAKIESNMRIECERMYKEINPQIIDQSRVDILIGKKTNDKYKNGKIKKLMPNELLEIIEVKRYEGDWKKVEVDFEKLFKLKKNLPNTRLFQIVVGQEKLPDKIFNSKHNLMRRSIYNGNVELKTLPRLSKKAFSTKKESEKGVYSILIEII